MSLAYRVECSRHTLATHYHVSKWYPSLIRALAAMEEQQQRPWNSVALVPQVVQAAPQEQLALEWRKVL